MARTKEEKICKKAWKEKKALTYSKYNRDWELVIYLVLPDLGSETPDGISEPMLYSATGYSPSNKRNIELAIKSIKQIINLVKRNWYKKFGSDKIIERSLLSTFNFIKSQSPFRNYRTQELFEELKGQFEYAKQVIKQERERS